MSYVYECGKHLRSRVAYTIFLNASFSHFELAVFKALALPSYKNAGILHFATLNKHGK